MACRKAGGNGSVKKNRTATHVTPRRDCIVSGKFVPGSEEENSCDEACIIFCAPAIPTARTTASHSMVSFALTVTKYFGLSLNDDDDVVVVFWTMDVTRALP
jgi:hypothetical protein